MRRPGTDIIPSAVADGHGVPSPRGLQLGQINRQRVRPLARDDMSVQSFWCTSRKQAAHSSAAIVSEALPHWSHENVPL